MNDLGYCEIHRRAFELVRIPGSWTFECPQCRQEGRYTTWATTSVEMNPVDQWLVSDRVSDGSTVKRKKGKWHQNDNGTWTCSLCQSWIPNEQHYYARYCLYCGAEMEDI